MYTEGCDHPIDLPFYAYLSTNEFQQLLRAYPEQAPWLRKRSIIETGYVLAPYQVPRPEPWNDELAAYLRTKECCYSNRAVISFEDFQQVFIRRFERYVASVLHIGSIDIMESVLLQHQIHDIHRLYPHVTDAAIIDHLTMLARTLQPLEPVLFYLTQRSVKASLEHTALIRSKPKWSAPETIEYYEQRKKLELEAIRSLSVKAVVIDNTDRNWSEVMERIVKELEDT